MIKTVVTEAIISKGYEGADAIKIIQGEKGDIARFRIGTKAVHTGITTSLYTTKWAAEISTVALLL